MQRHRVIVRGLLAAVVAASVSSHRLVAGPFSTRSPSSSREFCGRGPGGDGPVKRSKRPRLVPRDESQRDPEFASFQRRLLDAVARRDVSAILRVTDRRVLMDFGGGEGIEEFEALLRRADSDFWDEFPRALALGGTFRDAHYSAPYVFSTWPDEFDGFDCAAIVGSGVRLRDAPRATARQITTLDYDIVRVVLDETETPGWTQVQTATGLRGFVASHLVRSPTSYRARFARVNGEWRLVAFVAGD